MLRCGLKKTNCENPGECASKWRSLLTTPLARSPGVLPYRSFDKLVSSESFYGMKINSVTRPCKKAKFTRVVRITLQTFVCLQILMIHLISFDSPSQNVGIRLFWVTKYCGILAICVGRAIAYNHMLRPFRFITSG